MSCADEQASLLPEAVPCPAESRDVDDLSSHLCGALSMGIDVDKLYRAALTNLDTILHTDCLLIKEAEQAKTSECAMCKRRCPPCMKAFGVRKREDLCYPCVFEIRDKRIRSSTAMLRDRDGCTECIVCHCEWPLLYISYDAKQQPHCQICMAEVNHNQWLLRFDKRIRKRRDKASRQLAEGAKVTKAARGHRRE